MDRPDPPAAEAPPAPPAVPEPPAASEATPPEPEPAPPAPEAAASEPHPPTSVHRPHHAHVSSYRVLAHLAVVFVCLFLFVRVCAVEPFGVPTGSMAPALVGNHREAPCPRCGHPVRVGAPAGGDAARHYAREHVACPNCSQHVSLLDARDLNGDRLLVDKNVFHLRRPRRWEMAVFHCPDTDPKEYRRPYVKRVVGLPGERILIIDGDIYLVTGDGPADRELVRKGLAELRETRVLVFDMAHAPTYGWNLRWLVDPRGTDARLPGPSGRDPQPADSSVVAGGVLTLDGAANPQANAGATYRHWNLDTQKDEAIRAWSSYDGVPLRFDRPAFDSLPAARDFSVVCDVQVVATGRDASFACRLSDGADAVTAEVTVGLRSNGRVVLEQEGKGPLASGRGVSLEPGGTYRVEFSFVDRRATLAIDGKVVIPPADLPPPGERGAVKGPRLEARGCRLVIRNFQLYRDTHYTQYGEHGTYDEQGRPRPAVLGPDEYFMLGDNSGNSQDSRKWPTPGVPEGELIGKPFLIHQPLRTGRMTIGGRTREYQTVDWSRLRWLH
jgi:signal peptidase I